MSIMITNVDVLEAKVKAYNGVVAVMNKITPEVIEVVKTFEGQKITLSTGGFTKAFKKAIQPLLKEDKRLLQRPYITENSYSVSLNFRTTYKSGNCGCGYIDMSEHLGSIHSISLTGNSYDVIANLKEVPEYQPKKKTTLKKVLKANADIEKMKTDFNTKLSKIKATVPYLMQEGYPSAVY